ncbi:hypothetical protein GALMADRAFT_206178 [Galerina marginata CBS 339.88]|uniref:Uncharacterized protein n=1 Tax=Galerina marginata (strain CBS 339.88) TaxID=685588 RepID=A0A067TZZ8_GALM3|nr:hypothetical protein GALMADRAFT_206178 [Galerina marginata CBS 339.88]
MVVHYQSDAEYENYYQSNGSGGYDSLDYSGFPSASEMENLFSSNYGHQDSSRQLDFSNNGHHVDGDILQRRASYDYHRNNAVTRPLMEELQEAISYQPTTYSQPLHDHNLNSEVIYSSNSQGGRRASEYHHTNVVARPLMEELQEAISYQPTTYIQPLHKHTATPEVIYSTNYQGGPHVPPSPSATRHHHHHPYTQSRRPSLNNERVHNPQTSSAPQAQTRAPPSRRPSLPSTDPNPHPRSETYRYSSYRYGPRTPIKTYTERAPTLPPPKINPSPSALQQILALTTTPCKWRSESHTRPGPCHQTISTDKASLGSHLVLEHTVYPDKENNIVCEWDGCGGVYAGGRFGVVSHVWKQHLRLGDVVCPVCVGKTQIDNWKRHMGIYHPEVKI